MHVTLRYYGATSPEQLASLLAQELGPARGEAPLLHATKIDGFPEARRARVVFVALSDDACELDAATSEFQRLHITRVLERAHGNREAAAKLLGLSPALVERAEAFLHGEDRNEEDPCR